MSASRPLRIAFVADTVHSASGGGIRSAEQFVERLREEHQVITVSADEGGALRPLHLPVRAMQEMHFVMARPDRDVLAQAFEGVDLVHVQFPFWLGFAAVDVARRLGRPVVAAFHVQPENVLLNVGLRAQWLDDALYDAVVARLYNRVDGVVCPTAFARDKLLSHGLRTPALVVSNGVSPDVAQVAEEAAPPRRRADAPFTILAVGRLAAEKRQDVIVEAVRRSRHAAHIRLVLAGRGPREDALRELARSLPNGAEVGFLSRPALLRELALADLFVHASEVELEGMAVLEAMSVGVPAVVADAPESAASELALDARLRFPAGDAAALAAVLDEVIDRPLLLQSARRRARAQARHYDFDTCVRRLVEGYRSVIDRRAAGLSS